MKYPILKAQSGTKIPTNPQHKNYPKATNSGEIKKDTTSKLERSASNFYKDNIKGTPTEGIINTIIPTMAIATGNPIAASVGMGQLGFGTGNMALDASLGGVGMAAKVAAPILKVSKNLIPKTAIINGLDEVQGSKQIIESIPEQEIIPELIPA